MRFGHCASCVLVQVVYGWLRCFSIFQRSLSTATIFWETVSHNQSSQRQDQLVAWLGLQKTAGDGYVSLSLYLRARFESFHVAAAWAWKFLRECVGDVVPFRVVLDPSCAVPAYFLVVERRFQWLFLAETGFKRSLWRGWFSATALWRVSVHCTKLSGWATSIQANSSRLSWERCVDTCFCRDACKVVRTRKVLGTEWRKCRPGSDALYNSTCCCDGLHYLFELRLILIRVKEWSVCDIPGSCFLCAATRWYKLAACAQPGFCLISHEK